MKALVRVASGSPELRDVDVPVPTENEVLLRVHASSLNDYDLFILGRPPLLFRVVGSLLCSVSASAPPRVRIGGSDVAGSVIAVGSRVERFSRGDSVFGDVSSFGFKGFGAFAEYICAPESALLPKPSRMTFEQAAALPQAGALAMQGLLASGPLQPGWKILINGAGGGVGTIGVQVAKLQGAEVTGVDRASKLQMMRSIGFDHVINYEQKDFTKSGERYDLILDTKTNRSLFAYLRVLTTGGTYVTVGGETTTLFQFLIFGGLIRLLTGKKIVVIKLKQNAAPGGSEEVFRGGTPGARHRRTVQAERLAGGFSPLFRSESRRESDLDDGVTIIWPGLFSAGGRGQGLPASQPWGSRPACRTYRRRGKPHRATARGEGRRCVFDPPPAYTSR